jgi:hypothetical protein
MLDIVAHQDSLLREVTVLDTPNSDHYQSFCTEDHVRVRDLLVPVERFTDRERL